MPEMVMAGTQTLIVGVSAVEKNTTVLFLLENWVSDLGDRELLKL